MTKAPHSSGLLLELALICTCIYTKGVLIAVYNSNKKMNITKQQLDNWYDDKSDHLAEKADKDSVIANHQEFLAQRENWLALFNKTSEDVYEDKDGEHIFVEVEEINPNEDTAYTLTRQTLPETIQSRNINL